MQAAIGRFVQYLIRMEVICKEDAEIYEYGFWSAFLLIGNTLVSLFLFALTGQMKSGLLYLVLLIALRSYAGGYHSESALLCFFISQGNMVCSAFLAEWMMGKIGRENQGYFVAFGIAVAIVIIRFAPVEAEGNPLSVGERKLYQKIVAAILMGVAVGAVVLMCFGRRRLLAVWCVLEGFIVLAYLAAWCKQKRATVKMAE